METTPFQFFISATFTAEPVEAVLRFWERWLSANFAIRFAPYNQVLQSLAGEFGAYRHGLNAVLVRLEDLADFDWNAEGTPERLEANVLELINGLQRASVSGPLVVVHCPPSPQFAADPNRRRFLDRMAAHLTGLSGVHYISYEDVARLYPVADPASEGGDKLGKVPYTDLYFAALGTVLVRFAQASWSNPFKVIALDCDNTLWKGICGEDGPESIRPCTEMQQFMVRQHRAGMLLAMASKNNEQDVLDAFAAHPEMPLQLRHFAARRINWESKPQNLSELAEELSLGTDAFIFVDDSAKETAEVEESLPEVLSLTLPHECDGRFLEHVWAFDHWSITEEDRRRNEYLAGAQEFGHELKHADSLQHFMETLGLRLTFGTATPERLPRIAQLTQRTNQFNCSGIRRTEAELAGLECVTVEVADRFGEYGLTGVVLYRVADREMRVDTFVLSCRVLGRGVEHAVMAHLGSLAVQRGIDTIVIQFSPTAKNQPAQQFLESISQAPYRFKAADLQSVRWRPEPAKPTPAQPRSPGSVTKRPDYATIARELSTAEQIRDRIRGAATQLASPGFSETEQRLALIWSSLLPGRSIARSDNFFDLGGHSLLMVQMLMRIREEFGVELGVDDVYSATLTLRDLAHRIENGPLGDTDDYGDLLSEIEAMSDEEVARLLNEA